MRMKNEGGGMSFFIPTCDLMSISLFNFMAFAFASMDTRTDSFAAFVFVFAHNEAPQYIYMLF